MGSFTELSLSFYFREDTPPEVVATFSSLHTGERDSSWAGPPPALLGFDAASESDSWVPDWREMYGPDYLDPHVDEPWRHHWAPWLAQSMTVSTVPDAALVWSDVKLWHLSCRCSFKAGPQTVFEFLRWLGPFVATFHHPDYPRPVLVGMMTYDNAYRPYLLWCEHGRLTLENLNGPDQEF